MKLQNNSYSCGVYAVMNAAKCLGIDLPRKKIVQYSGTTKNGTSERGIIRTLRRNKFIAHEFEFSSYSYDNNKKRAIRILKNSLRNSNPVILCVDKNNHWCTVIGMLGNKFILFDSDMDLENKKEHGTQIVKENELVERWANYKNFYGIRVSLRKRRNNNR